MLSAANVHGPATSVRQLTPTPRTADYNASNLNTVLCEKLRESEPQYLADLMILRSKLGAAHPLASVIEDIHTAHSSASSQVNELDSWLAQAAPLYERYISILESCIDHQNADHLTKLPLKKLKGLIDFVASEGFEFNGKSTRQYFTILASRVEAITQTVNSTPDTNLRFDACFEDVRSLESLELVSATFNASSVMAEARLEVTMAHPLENWNSKPARALLLGTNSKLAGLVLCSDSSSRLKLLFPIFRRGDLSFNNELSTLDSCVLQTNAYFSKDQKITLSLKFREHLESHVNDFWNSSLRELFEVPSVNHTTELFDYRESSPARAVEITVQRQMNAKSHIIKRKKSPKHKGTNRKESSSDNQTWNSGSPGRGLGIQFNLEHPPVPSNTFSDELDAILGGSGPDTTLSFQKRPPSIIVKPHYYSNSPPLRNQSFSASNSAQKLDSLSETVSLNTEQNDAPLNRTGYCSTGAGLPPLPQPPTTKSTRVLSGINIKGPAASEIAPAPLLPNARHQELVVEEAPISTSSSPLLSSAALRGYQSSSSFPSPDCQLSRLQGSHSHMVKQDFARRPSANKVKTAPIVSSEFETVPLTQPEIIDFQPPVSGALLHRPKDSSPVFDDDSDDETPHREHGHFMRKVSGGLRSLHQRWRSKPLRAGTVRETQNARHASPCAADIFYESENDEQAQPAIASTTSQSKAVSLNNTSENVERSYDQSEIGIGASSISTISEVNHSDIPIDLTSDSDGNIESIGTAVYANSHNATVESGGSFSSLKSMSKSSSSGSYGSTISEPLSPYTNVTTKTSATSLIDRSVIFRGSAYVSQWHENKWLQLSKSALKVEISVSSDGCVVTTYDVSTGKLELELCLSDTSTVRKSTVLDVQILRASHITMFRLRNVQEAEGLFESLRVARHDVNQPLHCAKKVSSKFQAPSLSSDSSLESINGALPPPFATDHITSTASPYSESSPFLPSEQLALPPLLHGKGDVTMPSPTFTSSPLVSEPTLLLLSNLRCKWYAKSTTGEWSKDGLTSRLSVFSVPSSTRKRILVRRTAEHSSNILFDREVRARCFQRVGKCGVSIRIEIDHTQEAEVLHMIQFRGDKEARYVNELLTSE